MFFLTSSAVAESKFLDRKLVLTFLGWSSKFCKIFKMILWEVFGHFVLFLEIWIVPDSIESFQTFWKMVWTSEQIFKKKIKFKKNLRTHRLSCSLQDIYYSMKRPFGPLLSVQVLKSHFPFKDDDQGLFTYDVSDQREGGVWQMVSFSDFKESGGGSAISDFY